MFINLTQFQTLPWVWSKLNRRPWACSEISRFSTFHQHDTLSQLSIGHPEKLSSKPTWSIFFFCKYPAILKEMFGLVMNTPSLSIVESQIPGPGSLKYYKVSVLQGNLNLSNIWYNNGLFLLWHRNRNY